MVAPASSPSAKTSTLSAPNTKLPPTRQHTFLPITERQPAGGDSGFRLIGESVVNEMGGQQGLG